MNQYGAPTVIVNASNQATVLTYDAVWAGLVARSISSTFDTVQALYTTKGQVQSVTDVSWFGATTTYTYGAQDQIAQITSPGSESMTFWLDPSTGRRDSLVDARGAVSKVTFHYNGSNQPDLILGSGTLAQGLRYDVEGNLDQIGTANSFVTNITNDLVGRPWRTVAPVNAAHTTFTTRTVGYDKKGRVIGDTTASAGSERVTVLQSYDPEGNLLNVNRSFTPDPQPIGTMTNVYAYDNANRLLTETFPGNLKTARSYDNAGNITRDSTRRGLVTTMTYDAMNRVAQRTTPAVTTYIPQQIAQFPFGAEEWNGYPILAEVATFTYKADGQIATANNGDARIVRTYEANGLLRSETESIRNLADTFFTHSYQVQNSYDAARRRTAIHVPSQLAAGALTDSIRFSYLPHVGLEHVIDLLGDDIHYDYKTWGAPAHLYRPGGITESWDYDGDGNLSLNTVTNGSGAVLKYPQTTLRSVNFTYDGRGKALTANDANGFQDAFSATYSDLGYLQSSGLQQKGDLFNIPGVPQLPSRYHSVDTYTNDGIGNVTGGTTRDSTFFGGSQTPTRFSSSNRISTFLAQTGRLTTLDNAAGQRTFTYDETGNTRNTLIQGSASAPAEAVTSYYDAAEQIRGVERRWRKIGQQISTGEKTLTLEEYRYDALGRRVLVHNQRSCTNILESDDNALECQISAVRRTVWDGGTELAEISMPETAAFRENDTGPVHLAAISGLTINDPNPYYGRVIYSYGLQLDQPLTVARFGYADIYQGVVTDWTPFAILPLWNSRGQAPMGVFPDGAGARQLQAGGTACGAGLQRCVIVGWPDGWAAYDSRKGLPLYSWHGTLLENKRDKSGMEYKRNRVYDPQAGRFSQEDPIGLAGGLNAYGFANGDPVNFNDPFGLCGEKDKVHGLRCLPMLAAGISASAFLDEGYTLSVGFVLTGEGLGIFWTTGSGSGAELSAGGVVTLSQNVEAFGGPSSELAAGAPGGGASIATNESGWSASVSPGRLAVPLKFGTPVSYHAAKTKTKVFTMGDIYRGLLEMARPYLGILTGGSQER